MEVQFLPGAQIMKKIKKIAPICFLGLSSLISLLFTLGFGIGYSLGKFFIKRIYEGKSKLKPIILYIRNWEIHFHHWFISLLVLLSFFLSGIYSRIPIIFYGFLGGLIFQDIYWDRKLHKKHIYWMKKWYKILSKRGL